MRRTKHIHLLFALVLAAFVLPGSARCQEVQSEYGPLPVFEFHSSFWVNLHEFLYSQARDAENAPAAQNAQVTPQTAPGKTPALHQSSDALTPSEQRIWDQAVAYYRTNYAGKDPQVNLDLILLKNQLGDFEDCNELLGKTVRHCDAGLPGNIGVILEAAAPIYRKHWWSTHDRANRRWVARVAPLVREQGVGLAQRLADIYQTPWPKEKIRVDVSAYAGTSGAFTTLDPLRVTIASPDERNQDAESLEVLFHEASHGIALPVELAISRECKQRDKPIPRDLWHALIFYTTDEVLRPIRGDASQISTDGGELAPKIARTTPVPPDLREKLTERGWQEYIRLLNFYWQPYLEGRVTFEDAIAHLVSAA